MARTTINTQVIPDGTIVSADLSYPLTDFSSTGIDDNATSTAVTIDANENVGIGDTPSYRLDVLSSSGDVARIKSSNTRSDLWLQASGTTAGFVRLRASANDLQLIAGNSVGMTLDDTGNVGIGVTDPDVDLEVQSAAGTLKLSNNSAKAATEATVGQVEFAQHFGVNVSSSIAGIEQGGATDYAQGGMIFQTRPSGGSLTERMRIDSSGNVGIGTSGPDAKLDVKASTATVEVAARFRKGSTADTGGHTMLIGLGTEDAAWSKSAIGHQRNAPYDVGDLIFCLNSDAASGSDVSTSHERMRITSAGNVGIGTTAPTYKFVVSNNGEEGLEIDPINDPSTIRSFYYDRSTSSYIINKSFADQHVWTAGGSSEAMRLNGSGNLGIGTTTPIAKQHNLITSSGTALLLNNSAGGSGQYVDLDFNTYNVAVSGYANAAATIRVIDDGAFSGNITFRTKGASVGASQTERMRIDTSGNLLVGTTSTPTSATSQVFADNTKRYYFATKQIASGSTTSFFKITIAGANTRNVVDFELETASTSPSHGSSSMTSGQIILTRGKFDTNVRITTVINGTATTGAGGFVALTSSGSGNDATFTLQLQSYSPTHDQTCNIHIYSRATNIAVAAV